MMNTSALLCAAFMMLLPQPAGNGRMPQDTLDGKDPIRGAAETTAAWRPGVSADTDRGDSAAMGVRRAIAGLTNPEFERRKVLRSKFHRQGYTEVLYELQRHDTFGALIAASRMVLRLEFVIPRYPLTVSIPIRQPPSADSGFQRLEFFPSPPMVVRLREDRSLPEDPWAPHQR